MFNFYKVFSGHDMVTDAVRATTWRLKFTASSLQTESTKRKDLSRTWVLAWKHFENFRRKKTETFFLTFQKNPVEHMAPKRNCRKEKRVTRHKQTEKELKKHLDQKCCNFARLELRSKILTCSFSIKSSLVMTWSLTLSRLSREDSNSTFHRYKQKVQKMKYLSKTWVLTGKEIEDFRRNKNKKHF